jgi:hypothetical protein
VPDQLEGGTYEVLRRRLQKHGEDLQGRLRQLNEDRQEVFGAVEPSLVATERISTEYNCVARDIIAIGGGKLLFGYNVQMGLKSVTEVADVFDHYQYDPEEHHFTVAKGGPLEDPGFQEDFAYLYKYYRDTIFVKFMVIGPHLYMAFRVGKAVEDLKCFKWLLKGGGELEYIGNRFDHEYQFPAQQDFVWKRAHRGMFREGLHPHISIEDRLFVETVGGDLTIKIEDNTESGEGIYEEAVTNGDQTLDDAEVLYAIVGSLILLRILPYQEKLYRHLVYNEKTKTVTRIDSIANSCVFLPEDHGLIFSDGYYLQTGEIKRFQNELSDMLFERRIASPNGEDFLFVFYNRLSGHYILMPYNLITQSVETPIVCNGYTLFDDGELVYFRDGDEAQKHHALQVWQTPFTTELQTTGEHRDSFLFKVGNADIVKCMAECHEILNLLRKDDSYEGLYHDLASKSGDIIDTYFWAGDEQARDLRSALAEIKGAADSAIAEFEKVSNLRASTAKQMKEVGDRASETARHARGLRPDDIFGFVESLAQLRTVRGEVIALRDLRYHDEERIAALEDDIVETTERVSADCVEFLLGERALNPYRDRIAEQEAKVAGVSKVAGAEQVREELDKAGAELEMLIDIVGNLRIEDATETTKIIDDISGIYSKLNNVRAVLKNRRLELAKVEGEAQFGAQIQLLSQSVVNFLDLCDTPEKCDDYLSRTMIQLEELEGKFAEFDDYVAQIVEKRDEIYNAFETRKVQLLERQNQRSSTLHRSAGRILTTIQHRVGQLEEISEINGYLAGDLMVEKVRDIVDELTGLGDTVKADDVRTRLKTVRDDAVRQLKDRKELFVDGTNVIQFGGKKFTVNQQELELSIVPHSGTAHDGGPAFHLSGTEFFEEVEDEILLSAGPVATMSVVSENADVYRAEFLAWKFFRSGEWKSVEPTWAEADHDSRKSLLQAFMSSRYEEGYTKGVHDEDALLILDALIEIDADIGLLRFSPVDRVLARLAWEYGEDEWREDVKERIASVSLLRGKFDTSGKTATPVDRLTKAFQKFHESLDGTTELFADASPARAAHYWFEQLVSGDPPVISEVAASCYQAFSHEITGKRLEKPFAEVMKSFEDRPVIGYEVALEWTGSVLGEKWDDEAQLEAAWLVASNSFSKLAVKAVHSRRLLEGLSGQHARIDSGKLDLDFVHFVRRLEDFETEIVPAFTRYQKSKVELIEKRREEMRLEEFKPKVMSSFVRNRLLDRVYLPLIGDNLAKQMGTAGEDMRTDRMGMLLLISPPGYGKTTLMEYVANRLGITFMKINGPALGHEVTSLDPAEAPNASAREEIQKLNLAFEMGDNVMIYIDDIQHTHTEFLQKFISLCDAQRKIEGVWNGRPQTYDLRGKKVCVIMAGNPYTESGGKFQIPDMLANRADTYNLGDIIGEHSGDFEASYIENAMTSNSVLSRLASRSQEDVYAVMQIAETGSSEGVDFDGNYSPQEIEEMVSVMKKLMRVRDTILRVNLEYIRSAAMEDAYRTEPPFRLQGSYRNMNRIAEKILPVMTDEEVEGVIVDHYENESQTLTTGAESNLLKFREMEGTLSAEDEERWTEIKRRFGRNLLMGGAGENDPVSRVVGTLAGFSDGLHRIETVLADAAMENAKPATLADDALEKMQKIISDLRAVPVNVEIKVVPVQESGKPIDMPVEELPVKVESAVEQPVKKVAKKKRGSK